MKKIKEILGWIFGIIFVMGGLGTFSMSIISAIMLLFIGGLLLPISSDYINKYINIKSGKKVGIVILLFIIYGIFIDKYTIIENKGDNKSEKRNVSKKINIEKNNNKNINSNENLIGKYTIINIKDISHKVLLNKSLSLHTPEELNNLVIDKKIIYRVVFDGNIKNNQIRPTINKIISEITNKDKDIDELSLFIYSDKDLIDGAYDIGSATWAPKGKLGNITPEIAKNNIRNNYSISYEINVKDLEKYFKQRNKKEIKFNLTEEQRRQYFKDIVYAQDRARKEGKEVIINGKIIQEIVEENNLIREKYELEIRKKYGLTEEQDGEIIGEAFKENWPLQ